MFFGVVVLCSAIGANAANRYVDAVNGSDVNSGKSLLYAKATIQAAVDDASANDTIWVAAGTYSEGTTVTPGYALENRVVITTDITVRSISGPEVTIIEGDAAGRLLSVSVRGVYMSAGTLSGFTITNGHTKTSGDGVYDQAGAGIFCSDTSPVINNCIVRGNTANASGGGMFYGTANNCIFSENVADHGGGVYGGTVNNCIVWGNTATYSGGGMYDGTANNCIVWGNTANQNDDLYLSTLARYSCSPDLSTNSYSNIFSNPQFIDAAAGNFHLASTSPCIDAGNNGYASTLTTDLDGNSRIINNTVDMGVYEALAGEDPGSSPIHYVSEGNSGAEWPYSDWSTAAATIQDAVDTAAANDTVLVTNGTYSVGTTVTPDYELNNRVVITKEITVSSVNGPEVTIIAGAGPEGSNAVRGVYMSAGTLSGFTVTNGHTQISGDALNDRSGGGIYCLNYDPVITHCIIRGNSASGGSGGMFHGTANNCIFTENSADFGGGMGNGTANFCTFSENSARYGGGMSYGWANNCIVWGNTATIQNDNLDNITATYTCSPDVSLESIGNITNNPQFVDAAAGDFRLQNISPCIDAGNTEAVSDAVDLDGNLRISNDAVDMGAYEASPFHYVSKGNSGAQWPYDSWSKAAATIQDAVDAATANDTVLVTNGTYNVGTTVTPGYALNNRVVITNNLTVRSVNGPMVTIIEGTGPEGSNAVRGVYMSAGTLSGFTVTNGHPQTSGDLFMDRSGGGIRCAYRSAVVTNCILIGNTTFYNGGGMYYGTANNCTFSENTATYGGGMRRGTANNCTFIGNMANDGAGNNEGTLYNCIFIGNQADRDGGGMRGGMANNCTFYGNTAGRNGGGVAYGTADNSIIWGNTATSNGVNFYSLTASHTCSPELTDESDGNITDDPQFVDAAVGDYRLQSTSPCIDAGDASVFTLATDLDGNPRIVGIIDMGAYEFEGTAVDSDGDGMSDADEQIAGTDISDSSDYFRIESVATTTGSGTTLEWTAQDGRLYTVWWASALTNEFQWMEPAIEYPLSTYTDTAHPTQTTGFYKVKVELQ
jgi:parallel beta-helix repeat protein